MTPERIEQERKAFEAWMAELYPTNPQTERVGDEYSRLGTQYKWEGWQAKAAQSEWISVEERLPEAHDDILVYTCDGDIYPITAMRRDITWIGISGATHWQPLPTPPTTNPAA